MLQLEKVAKAIQEIDNMTTAVPLIDASLINHYLEIFANIANANTCTEGFITTLQSFCQRCQVHMTIVHKKNHKITISLTLKNENQPILEPLLEGIASELNKNTNGIFSYYTHWIGHNKFNITESDRRDNKEAAMAITKT